MTTRLAMFIGEILGLNVQFTVQIAGDNVDKFGISRLHKQ